MIIQVFSVFDSKAKVFQQPFFSHNVGTALRSWEQAVAKPDSIFAQYPADFTLFNIGTFNDETGELVKHSEPLNCGLAARYVKEKASAS